MTEKLTPTHTWEVINENHGAYVIEKGAIVSVKFGPMPHGSVADFIEERRDYLETEMFRSLEGREP